MDFKKILSAISSKTAFILTILIILLINYISANHFFRFDLTKEKRYTISKSTKNILRNLDDYVTIKVFFSQKLPPNLINLSKEIKDTLEEYKAYSKGNLNLIYLDPDKDDKIKNEARSLGIPEIQMNIVEKDKFQVQNGFLGIGIFYEDKKEIIPVIENTVTLEYDLTSAIKKIASTEIKKVGFLQGHSEHSLEKGERLDYTRLKKGLEKNYELKEVNLTLGDSLKDIDTLIIAGPTTPLKEEEIFDIDQFIMKGGKAVFLIDSISINDNLRASKIDAGLKSFLEHFGATLIPSMLLDVANYNASFSSGFVTFITPYPYWIKALKNNFSPDNPAIANIESLLFPWVSALEVKAKDQYEIKILAKTTDKSWSANEPFNLSPEQNFMPSDQQSYPLIALISGKLKSFYADKKISENPKLKPEEILKESVSENHIFVAPDSDFISDEFINQEPYNLSFFLNIVDFLTLGEDLISIRSKRIFSRPIEEISETSKGFIKGINMVGIPALVIAYGILRAYLRKRRQKSSFFV